MRLFIKATHKYISKKRNKKGGYDYVYPTKQVKKKRNKEEILAGARARAKERALIAEADADYKRIKSKAKDAWIEERADAIDALQGDKPIHPKMVVDFDAVTDRIQAKGKTPEQKLVMQFNRFFSDLYTGFSITELNIAQWLRKNTTYLDDILNSDNPELAFDTITTTLKDAGYPRDIGNMIYLNADLNDIDEVRSTLFRMNRLYKEGGGKHNKVFMAHWLRNQNKDWHYFASNIGYSANKSDFEQDWGKGVSAGSILAEAYDNDISFEQAFQDINDRYGDRISIAEFYTPDNLKPYLNNVEYTEVLDMIAIPFAEIEPLTASKGINESYKALGVTGDFYCVKPRSGEYKNARHIIDTGTFAVREAGAYIIDKALGFDLVPPTILRQDEVLGLFSMQLWEEEGAIGSAVNYHVNINEHNKFKASIFDFIAFNTDRHDGNFIVNSFGDVTLIDNGLCMPYAEDGNDNYKSILHESLVRDLIGGGEYVSDYPSLQIPDTVMEQLNSVNISELGDTLMKLGIDKESVDLMKGRFNCLMQNETLPGTHDLDVQPWSNQ